MNLFAASKSNLFGSGPLHAQQQQQQGDAGDMAQTTGVPTAPSRQLCAASASVGAQEVSQPGQVEFGSPKYYALCGIGGVLSCGLTHTAVTPLDLVKCRLQVDKERYKNLGTGFKVGAHVNTPLSPRVHLWMLAGRACQSGRLTPFFWPSSYSLCRSCHSCLIPSLS